MDNQVAVTISTEIPELCEGLDQLRKITHELNAYIEVYKNKINLNDLTDWKLLIWINLRNTNGIGIFKRARRSPSDKEFQISISITLPNSEDACYGISNMTGVYVPLNVKNFHSYIFESAIQAINTAFTYGFTCNGKRIKVKNEFITSSTPD